MNCSAARPNLAPGIRGELDAGEATELEAHVSSCKSCARERLELTQTMARTAESGVEPAPAQLRSRVVSEIAAQGMGPLLELAVAAPSPDLKARVLEAVRREASPAPGPKLVAAPSPGRVWIARGLAAAAVLAAGVVLGSTLPDDRAPEIATGAIPRGHETQVLALSGEGPATAEVRHYRHDNFRITMSIEGFDPTPAGSHYAVWVRGPGGDVALGTFRLKRPDDFHIAFALGVNPSDFPAFAVTLEPNDGGPALDGEVVAQGRFDPEKVHHGTYDE